MGALQCAKCNGHSISAHLTLTGESGSIAAAAAATKSLQSCPTLSDPMDCSLPGSSVHGILQARVLEWGAIAPPTLNNKEREWGELGNWD